MATLDDINVNDAQSQYENNAPQAASLYQERAAAASSKWQSNASAGQDAYEQAMRDQEVLSRRAQRINSDSASKYQSNVQAYGASRYRQGVEQNADRFSEGFRPIAEALSGAQIPDRGPTMSEANFERVREVARIANEASNRQS